MSELLALLLVEIARKAEPGDIEGTDAVATSVGGDCLADVGMLRAEPAVFGRSPTRRFPLVDALAAGPKALSAIRAARAEARERVWNVAKTAAPGTAGQVIVDLCGVLVPARSQKQDATAIRKKTFGHRPLMGFVDHGRGGSREPVAGLLRPGHRQQYRR